MEVINGLTILLLVLVMLLEHNKGNISSPLFAFCGIWAFILSLYTIRLFGVFTIQTGTAWLVFSGVICFALGYLVNSKITIRTKIKNSEPNWGMFRIICLAIIVISTPFYFSSIMRMLQGGINSAAYKLLLATGEVDNGNFVIQYVVRPFEFLIMGMSAYVFSKSIKERLIFVSGIYVCVIKFLTTGSKTAILYYGMAMLLALLNNTKRGSLYLAFLNISFKKKVSIISVAIAFILAVVSSSGEFFKSMYTYFVGCMPLLDQVLNSSFYFNGVNMQGMVSFNGIIRFFINLFELFGVSLNTSQFNEAADIISRFEYTTQISNDTKYNAFTTYISYFYIDFGSIGVAICSFIFGSVVCYIYRKYKQDASIARYAQLALVYYMVIFSNVRFQLSHTVIAMAFIYSILLIVLQNTKVTIGSGR